MGCSRSARLAETRGVGRRQEDRSESSANVEIHLSDPLLLDHEVRLRNKAFFDLAIDGKLSS